MPQQHWLPLPACRDVCAVTKDAWDMQDKTVGTVGAGHIGRAVMERLAVSLESAPAGLAHLSGQIKACLIDHKQSSPLMMCHASFCWHVWRVPAVM